MKAGEEGGWMGGPNNSYPVDTGGQINMYNRRQKECIQSLILGSTFINFHVNLKMVIGSTIQFPGN